MICEPEGRKWARGMNRVYEIAVPLNGGIHLFEKHNNGFAKLC